MRFAYFCLPHIGGTYSVFKQLRKGLAPHGIDVTWLGAGRTEAFSDPLWRSELELGTSIDPAGVLSQNELASALINALRSGGYDGVFVNVLADRVQTNLMRYLPEDLLRVMIVHNITPGTYAAACSIRDNVHATVGVSERCAQDLITRFGFASGQTVAIPNAVDVEAYEHIERQPRERGKMRMVFLGRVEDASKGVFWLPKLLGRLPGNITLTVAGDGPDLPKLKQEMQQHRSRVTFAGRVAPEDVPELLAAHDLLIMPSRYEGFGITLVEAMAAGCVPVVSRIRGVTDTIVDHEKNGLLFTMGSMDEAASQILGLSKNPKKLDEMAKAAQIKAATGFSLEAMATRYAHIIGKISQRRPAVAPQLPLEQWSLPAGLRPGLRTYLPPRVKNWLRLVKERI
ncbi:glycosyltransferase family 4 protein [Mesorhizobium sp. SB112]|uniref:glycosyltransferase family 4 protein n=1 Tax=Mesorhizobium sp. SB112 TaxID=3151853 RepID=UPI003265FBB1